MHRVQCDYIIVWYSAGWNRLAIDSLISPAPTSLMALQMSTTNTAAVYTHTDIVARVVALVPQPTTFIPELVKAQLPQVIPEDRMKVFPAEDYLVDLPVSGTLTDVLEGPLPHRTWLACLTIELETARGSGRTATAIRHPTRVDLIPPLWALPVWDLIAVASQERMLWAEATMWLSISNHRQDDHKYVEHARTLMEGIPWGMMVWALPGLEARSLVRILTRFASFLWLAKWNIDLIQLRILGGGDATAIPANSGLRGWKATVDKNHYHFIYIPANIANIHWVVFCINTEDQTYCWGT